MWLQVTGIIASGVAHGNADGDPLSRCVPSAAQTYLLYSMYRSARKELTELFPLRPLHTLQLTDAHQLFKLCSDADML